MGAAFVRQLDETRRGGEIRLLILSVAISQSLQRPIIGALFTSGMFVLSTG
jgi:hypothetical protein